VMGNNEVREHWKDSEKCESCKVELGLFNRHHCRKCGGSFCTECSKYLGTVGEFYHDTGPKRLCAACYKSVEKERKAEEKKKNVGLSDFELLTLIGSGKYGKVVKVKEKATGKIFAMKVLIKKNIVDGGEVQHTITERNVLMKVKHPFLMRLRYAFQTQEKLLLLMDFVNGGELFYHLQQQPGRKFSNERARFYAAEIGLGIEHLHNMGIIYRDLKPENVLVDSEGHIRLTDFGLSKEGLYLKGDKTNTFCGTPEYLAPEILSGSDYNNAVDWWAFGALIYEMLTGWAPFYEKDIQKMYQHKVSRRIGVPDYVDPNAKHLLIRLLDRNPETRLTDPKKIKAHPWFASLDWEKLYRKEIEPPYKPAVPEDSTAMIDTFFTSKNINEEIGPADEQAIDDKTDPSFKDYSYYPERDPADIETGSWPPTGKSAGFECLSQGEEDWEPSKSQPSSYTQINPGERILEEHGLGRNVD